MMESENQSDSVETQVETTAEDTMAPLESELGDKSQESQENVPNVKGMLNFDDSSLMLVDSFNIFLTEN